MKVLVVPDLPMTNGANSSVMNWRLVQLGEANKRLSTAPRETIIEYTITNSELLESCTAEYRSMAEKADGHAIDVERLSGTWPIKEPLK